MVDFQIGSLRHLVTILAPTNGTQDSATGETPTTWAPVVELLPAKIETTSAEVIKAGQDQNAIHATVTIRWRDDVTSLCRVEFGMRQYEINGTPIDPDGRRRWLIINAVSIE